MGHEANGEPERALDLRRVPVRPDLVGREVLEDEARVRARRWAPAGTGDARLRVDDDVGRIDRGHERREREERGSRIAPGVRDERAGRRPQLGQPVLPASERRRSRVLPAVPLRVGRRLQTVCTGEVDDDGVRRRLDLRSALVAEAEEDQVGSGGERLRVRRKGRQLAVEAHVESSRRLSCQRVRAERDDLELRVSEDAVEGLLSRVSRGSEDRRAHWRSIMPSLCVSCTG